MDNRLYLWYSSSKCNTYSNSIGDKMRHKVYRSMHMEEADFTDKQFKTAKAMIRYIKKNQNSMAFKVGFLTMPDDEIRIYLDWLHTKTSSLHISFEVVKEQQRLGRIKLGITA